MTPSNSTITWAVGTNGRPPNRATMDISLFLFLAMQARTEAEFRLAFWQEATLENVAPVAKGVAA